jgi:hypothetical protein
MVKLGFVIENEKGFFHSLSKSDCPIFVEHPATAAIFEKKSSVKKVRRYLNILFDSSKFEIKQLIETTDKYYISEI